MAYKTLAVVYVILIHFNFLTTAQIDTVHYDLGDNTLEETFIGNVVSSAELQLIFTTKVLESLSYVFLNKADYIEYFILEKRTGNIKTSQLVDRDVVCPGQNVCQLELDIAVQPNTYFRVIKVFITIEDVNDNAPKFKQRSFTYDLPESTSPGIIAPLLPADDIDSPANGVKGYKMVDSYDKFQLNVQNNTGFTKLDISLVLLHSLDREVLITHHLKVIAYDGGSPSRSGTLDIFVNVLDVNDNHPQFEYTSYQIEVNESYPVGEPLIQVDLRICNLKFSDLEDLKVIKLQNIVHATDDDYGLNGHVVYNFSQNTVNDVGNIFELDAITGIIKLKRNIDFETRSSYSLTVVAQDQGINSIPSNSKVLVTVLDVNDIVPEIIINNLPTDGFIYVMENMPEHTFVSHISVHDEEHGENGRAQCIITENNFFVMEKLYEKEYKVITASSIDREKNSQFLMRITCNDFGIPSLQTEVEVLIMIDDENDNSPVFLLTESHIQVEEGNPFGSRLTKVEAIDPDKGLNGQVRYFCEHDFFEINAISGVVTSKKQFDREEKQLHYLDVIARDLGDDPKYNSTVLVIEVLDIDDNEPTFKEKLYHMNIKENAPLQTFIGQVSAEDIDSNTFNKFYYYLGQTDMFQRLFIVDIKTGDICSNFSIDRETKSQYKFHVYVSAKENPLTPDYTVVIVDVLDENDNAPIISFPSVQSNHILLSSKTPVGRKVTKVVSYDVDAGNNSALSYQLAKQNGEYFFIDSNTGNLYVNKELLSFDNERITLQILVSDFGTPRKTSVSSLYITVNSSVTHISVSSVSGSDSVDVIAIVIGCLCGVLIAVLLLVLFILLVLRQKRKKQDSVAKPWQKSSHTIENRHFHGDGQEDNCTHDVKKDLQCVTTRADYLSVEQQKSPTIPPVNVQTERDSDSGCFDWSHSENQSSNEIPQCYADGKMSINITEGCSKNKTPSSEQLGSPFTVVQTKCYHPRAHQTNNPQSMYVNTTMSTFNPQSIGVSSSDKKKERITNQEPNPDFLASAAKLNQLGNDESTAIPQFSEYLQNESQKLKQKGHVYNVSNPCLKSSNSVKKTVRFTEPENVCDTQNDILTQENESQSNNASFQNPNKGNQDKIKSIELLERDIEMNLFNLNSLV